MLSHRGCSPRAIVARIAYMCVAPLLGTLLLVVPVAGYTLLSPCF